MKGPPKELQAIVSERSRRPAKGPLILASLLVLALAGVVWLVPGKSLARKAVDRCDELLLERVGPEPAAGENDERPMLARLVLLGPAARLVGDRTAELVLYGVRIAGDAATGVDLAMSVEVRARLVRALRAFAEEEGLELRIVGEEKPEPGGANFLLQVEPEGVILEYSVDGAALEPVRVQRTWSRRRSRCTRERRGARFRQLPILSPAA